MAVLISLLLESWGEGKSPSYFTRTTPLKGGAVDHAGVQWSTYGGKEGIWRLIRTLDSCHMRGAVFCNALSAELYPDAIKQIVKSGHLVEAHGYSQDQYLLEMTPEVQKATIRRKSRHARRRLRREARGLGDLGLWLEPAHRGAPGRGGREILFRRPRLAACRAGRRTAAGEIVALPWSEFVDNRVLKSSPRDFFDVYKDTFDYLYAQEPAGIVHLGVHAHFGGRPAVTAQLYKLLRYFSEFNDVWFPTHREMADWFIADRGRADVRSASASGA